MSVDLFEREKSTDLKPKRTYKARPPKRYNVIFNEQLGFSTGCQVSVLMEVFRMSVGAAFDHAQAAAQKGREPVMETTQDIAETKAAQANAAKQRHAMHNPYMNYTHFTAEPADP